MAGAFRATKILLWCILDKNEAHPTRADDNLAPPSPDRVDMRHKDIFELLSCKGHTFIRTKAHWGGQEGPRLLCFFSLYHTIWASSRSSIRELGSEAYPTREDLLQRAMKLWEHGQLAAIPAPIKQRRELVHGVGSGAVSLALNGHVGRRVACVLDGEGAKTEALNLEADELEEDEEA
uniref:Uncharacterized protein n=1 Tax=Mycena chlorophos TaxID=658473 RepID=A0ABQ0KZ94_MYCCL|nr:predicted protein [Mycena chlorophos]